MNSDLEIICREERFRPKNSEVNRLFGDNSLLLKLTDWNPKFSGKEGFKEGLKKTIEWFTRNKDYYKNNSKEYII